jgi:hypothetical protein
MATFGQGINPALGRIDYSGYQQGAMAGSQAVGQGIAALGEAAGAAINKYYYNKETSEIGNRATESIINGASSSPAVRDYLKSVGVREGDFGNTKVIKAAIKGVGGGDLRKGSQITLSMLAQLGQQEAENKAIRAAMASPVREDARLNQYLGAGGQNAMGFLKTQSELAQAQSGISLQKAQTQKALAEAKALETPEPPKKTDRDIYLEALLMEQESKQPGSTKDPRVYSAIMAKAYAPSGGQSVTVNQGDNILNQAFRDLSGRMTAEITPALSALPAIDAMEALLDQTDEQGKVISGTFAPAELATKAALNRVGLANFKDVAATQEYIGISGRLVATIIKDFGSGTGLSDEDRKFAIKLAAGDTSMTKEALVRLVKIARKGVQNRIKNYNADVSRMFPGESPQEVMGRRLMIPDSYIGGDSGTSVFDQADAINPSLTPISIPKPDGIPQSEWDFMSPEDKALFR